MRIRFLPFALKFRAFGIDTSLIVVETGKKANKKEPRPQGR